MSKSGELIESLLDCSEDILETRDCVGAALKEVFIVTRTWSGDRPGNGQPEDKDERILPTPRVVDYSHDIRLREGGGIKEGDIILKGISKNKYSDENYVRGKTTERNVEVFYQLGGEINGENKGELYKVISVMENYLTWDVQLRRLSSQEQFDNSRVS